jgi:hypothetical protein
MLLILFLILYVLDRANKGKVEIHEAVLITVYALLTLTLHMADRNV